MARYRYYQPDKTYDLLPNGEVLVYFDPIHNTETNATRDPETEEETTETKDVYDYLIVTADSLDRSAIIVALIRAEYSADDELAIQRQKDDKPSEYNHYNAYVEKCKAIAKRTLEGDTLETAKAMKIADLGIYDASDAVNEFTVGGVGMWLSPARRSNLKNSAESIKEEHPEITTVQYFGQTLPIDTALSMLAAIESYAGICSQVTDAHRAAISALQTIAAVNNYDFTTNYPLKLQF